MLKLNTDKLAVLYAMTVVPAAMLTGGFLAYGARNPQYRGFPDFIAGALMGLALCLLFTALLVGYIQGVRFLCKK